MRNHPPALQTLARALLDPDFKLGVAGVGVVEFWEYIGIMEKRKCKLL